MSTTANLSQVQGNTLAKAVQSGVIAGIGGGLVFGVLMATMGMLPMVGMLVGVPSALVGFGVHLLISAFIGATFGVIANFLPATALTNVLAGLGYGIVWWVLGALVLMPLTLGMTEMVLKIGNPQWMSLLGHGIFGAVTGYLFHRLR